MKNFFSKLSHGLDGIKNQVTSKGTTLMDTVKKKVLALTAATALGVSQPAIASDWHKVDTPGIGPQEFSQKNFGTKEWQNLVDRDGKRVKNPATDLVLGREYTLQPEKKETIAKVDSPKKPEQRIETRGKTEEKVEQTIEEKVAKEHTINLEEFKTIPYISDFDIRAYKKAVTYVESRGNHGAVAINRNKKGEIDPKRKALGLFQILQSNIIKYAQEVNYPVKNGLGGIVNHFKTDITFQNITMDLYIRDSFYSLQRSGKTQAQIQSGMDLAKVMADMHFKGFGSIKDGIKDGKTDGRTKDTDYRKMVVKKYFEYRNQDTRVASNDETYESPTSVNITPAPSVEMVTQKVRASNDEVFMLAGDRAIIGHLDEKYQDSIGEKITKHGTLLELTLASREHYMNELRTYQKIMRTATIDERRNYIREVVKLNELINGLDKLLKELPEAQVQKAA